MKKAFAVVLALLCLLTAFSGLAESQTLTAPENFTFNTETGEYSFTATDKNTGYYFIRIYPVTKGVESDRYVGSSKRINGKKTGQMSGKVDVSGLGWGEYHIKLISFAASGTSFTTPDPVISTAFYGVGGVLEKPEMMVLTDGNTAECIIDWYTLSDYKVLEYLPEMKFTVYADEACSTEVASEVYDLAPLGDAASVHPAGGLMWQNFKMYGFHDYVMGNECNYTMSPEVTFTLDAGTYYITAQAISADDTKITSSKVSDVLTVTVTAEEPNGEFEAVKSARWQDPAVMGVMNASAGADPEREDIGSNQTTTSYAE